MIVLQSAWDTFFSGSWLDAILQPFLSLLGGWWVGMIVLGIMGILYVDTRDLILPAVLAMLTGGLVVQFAPPGVANAGMLIMILGAALAVGRTYLRGSDPGR